MTIEEKQVELSKAGKRNMKDFLEASRNSPPVPMTPEITQVCRALRAETLGIFYGSNIFELNITSQAKLEHVLRWLRNVPPIGLLAIRQIVIISALRGKSGVAVHLPIDLNSGKLCSSLSVLPNDEDEYEYEYEYGLWCTMSWLNPGLDNFWFGNQQVQVRLPAHSLGPIHRAAKLVHGLGDGKMMTYQRLTNIVRVFDLSKYEHIGWRIRRADSLSS